jgi:peptidoglycan/LPS O-acetylase OafA/YrhL
LAALVFAASLAVAAALLRMARAAPGASAWHRERHLDGLRGLAAVAVLASHFAHDMAQAVGAGVGSGALTYVFHNLGTVGVQVFFALTGFLFTRKAVAASGDIAIRAFFVARLRRIVPMYAFAIALSIAAVCWATWQEPVAIGQLARQALALFAYGFTLDGAPAIKSVPYVQVIGTIWSLPFEWGFYLFVPVLAALVRSWRLLAAAGLVAGVYFANLMWTGTDVFSPFFLPGILLGLLPLERWRPSGRARTALAGVALLLALACVLPGEQNFTPIRLLLMTLLFAAIVLAAPAALAARPVAYLGDISYSVYLLQFPLLFTLHQWLDPAGLPAWLRAVSLLAGAALVVAASALTWRMVERPFLRPRAFVAT